MKQQAYYRNIQDNDNDYAVTDTYLIVNCAGCQVMQKHYVANSVRNDYFLLYMVKGSISVQAGKVSAIMTPGECIIFTPHIPFYFERVEHTELVYVWVHFSGNAAAEVLKSCGLSTGLILQAPSIDHVVEKFQMIFQTFSHRDSFLQLDAIPNLISLLALIGRKVQQSKSPLSTHRNRMEKSLQYIHEHFHSQLTLQQLADMEHLSISHYRTVFTEILGVSPYEYILLQRMNRACDLLRHSLLSCAEIAEMIGYEDQRYFSRLFKIKMGMTPQFYKSRKQE
ncbi:HTH-type transcriptional activator Btr [Paenibacillus allorhizoplanae]|uniref:HTH-type transcriptional activator Btr n=1 Tax=Paenibacillus allorhizoplanae TaxID=2905648 RepID=A0ABM9CWZ8_9BACL|nr:AraC family transcriptional regulator [Paenibacillus allorhizoplanae]CAH1228021.1 HTH-type transcriptional activator Btr [Paenibacillus allorhizoplanae]